MQDWYPTRYVKGIFGSVEVFHLKEISLLHLVSAVQHSRELPSLRPVNFKVPDRLIA